MNNIHTISSMQLAKTPSNTHGLKNGSNVFVRVLSQGAGNSYVVSFEGSKLSVFSQKNLQPGSAFRATVTVTDGKIFLTPNNDTNNNSIQKISVSGQESIDSLRTFIQDLGLKPDAISMRIIHSFQAAGLSFNMKLATKARSIGLHFPGSEDDAAELALFLEQKGIKADVDSVMTLLGLLYGDDSSEANSNSNSRHSHEETCENESSEKVSKKDGAENDESNEQSREDILSTIYAKAKDICNKNAGLLTLLNHTYTNNLHWILLPFEYGENEHVIVGSVRFLINIDKKNTEKMVIYAFFCGKNYKIVINCRSEGERGEQQYSIQFCTDQKESELSSKRLCDLLIASLPKDIPFDVSYVDDVSKDGIFTLNSHISVVKLDA